MTLFNDRFSAWWHPTFWVFGFTFEPGGYLFMHFVFGSIDIHFGRAR